MVFTTVSCKELTTRDVLELYRVRWQIELRFKHLKSLLGLGCLPKYDDASCRAWIQAKLLCGLLIERLMRQAKFFFPWGYRLPATEPLALLTARALCPIKGFQWAEASVRLNVVVLRETYADAHQDDWALLTTEDFVDPQTPPQDYRRRSGIEERHRQLKCFHDLTDFHSRSFNAIAAQVVFVLLSYTLRQWQLWKFHQEQLARRHPDFIQDRLNLEHQFVVIYHQHAYVQLPLLTFTREVLELTPEARERALRQIRRLEQSFLTPVKNLRPHCRSP